MAAHRTIEFTENIIQGWDAVPATLPHSPTAKSGTPGDAAQLPCMIAIHALLNKAEKFSPLYNSR